MSTLEWDQQRAFLAVVREGSLSGAARALGLAQPTVRRRIEELEAALGAVLFTRSPGGLQPTDLAAALTGHAEAMAMAADAFVRSASAAAHEVAGTVRISASDVIAIEVLPPILAGLAERHPRLAIALSPSNRTEDVLRREADVAVRMVPPSQDALVARRIGQIPLGLHAHRSYVARRGLPASLADLRGHGLIGVERDSPILRAVRAHGYPVSVADFSFRSEDDLAQLAAIRAGLGIGLCQVPLAARDPDLLPVLHEGFTFPLETWVVCHEDQRDVARVRAVFDALVDGLLAYLGECSG
ncbi:LysR family transcriptional regulator [Sphingomonas canadensis]|uniref:LysR family transcriptional regulator n=1 Tax=Sphingomonas canadensis TaxID=1219257 RepID=A0ABW3H5C8_9SPHN|nr:LysR family transcriptional regulator [Sphingomonas canadensis]MCW3835235.1 LysR family transcriptional regulator [Sphingomonas canadensis]